MYQVFIYIYIVLSQVEIVTGAEHDQVKSSHSSHLVSTSLSTTLTSGQQTYLTSFPHTAKHNEQVGESSFYEYLASFLGLRERILFALWKLCAFRGNGKFYFCFNAFAPHCSYFPSPLRA